MSNRSREQMHIEIGKLIDAIAFNNVWYKNCKNVRKRGGKICKVCPFREIIELAEGIREGK
jgi:DNA modification methylase